MGGLGSSMCVAPAYMSLPVHASCGLHRLKAGWHVVCNWRRLVDAAASCCQVSGEGTLTRSHAGAGSNARWGLHGESMGSWVKLSPWFTGAAGGMCVQARRSGMRVGCVCSLAGFAGFCWLSRAEVVRGGPTGPSGSSRGVAPRAPPRAKRKRRGELLSGCARPIAGACVQQCGVSSATTSAMIGSVRGMPSILEQHPPQAVIQSALDLN